MNLYALLQQHCLKKHVLKYVSLDVTGNIIHRRIDQHFVDMSFTQSSVLNNIYFVAAG